MQYVEGATVTERMVMSMYRQSLIASKLILVTVAILLPGQAAADSELGEWVAVAPCTSFSGYEDDFDCSPGWPHGLQAIHAVLLKNGKVLLWRWTTHESSLPSRTHLWDPVTLETIRLPATSDNIFCAGHVVLDDGRLLAAGGQIAGSVPANCWRPYGGDYAYIFDPDATSPAWEQTESMSLGRWYPTLTLLANGHVLVTSGEDCVPDGAFYKTDIQDPPEVYDPAVNTFSYLPGSAEGRYDSPWYPFMFALSNRQVLHVGPYLKNKSGSLPSEMEIIDPLASSSSWSDFGSSSLYGGSAVLFTTNDPQSGKALVLKVGGHTNMSGAWGSSRDDVEIVREDGDTYAIDNEMQEGRHSLDTTVLTDGRVLISGGSQNGTVDDSTAAALTVDIFDPSDSTITAVADSPRHRMYHSTALLLPDGRVLVAGGEMCGVNEITGNIDCDTDSTAKVDNKHADFYYPPYLFDSNDDPIESSDRPAISNAPALVATGSSFSVTVTNGSGDSLAASKTAFIRPGAVTHAFNQDQRYVPLQFSSSGNTRTVTAPTTAEEVPPGYYMLFFHNNLGYPSIGEFIRVWGIVQSSIAHANLQAEFGNVIKADIEWDTSIGSTGNDQIRLYRTSSQTTPTVTLTCSDCGSDYARHHSNEPWEWSCEAGNWYYEVVSNHSGTTSVSERIYLGKITNCVN